MPGSLPAAPERVPEKQVYNYSGILPGKGRMFRPPKWNVFAQNRKKVRKKEVVEVSGIEPLTS